MRLESDALFLGSGISMIKPQRLRHQMLIFGRRISVYFLRYRWSKVDRIIPSSVLFSKTRSL